MRYSESFIKTNKDAKEFDSVNATLLQKGSFVDQTMAGVYTFLPLGWRVLNNIESIVREEMNTVGAEMFMPTLSPKTLWQQTGRIGVDILLQAVGANNASQAKNPGGYIINPTHEEVITPIAKRLKPSYRDLPFAVYQIQTKFRNEERAKSGLLRGREFRMKDLYSFHATKKGLEEYYEKVKTVYMRIYERLGMGEDTVIALAGGGDFTSDYTHEFQTKCAAGEDTIYYDAAQDVHYNSEVVPEEVKTSGESFKASEVGNIFPLGTKFTEAFEYTYTDEQGKPQAVHMASYGIGTSRIMGVLVEKFHDDHGIIWPVSVAPFRVYLASLHADDADVSAGANAAYEALAKAGVEVLYDDRKDTGPGEKLADADLFGIPWRAVVSKKTEGKIELKRRTSDATEMIDIADLVKKLSVDE